MLFNSKNKNDSNDCKKLLAQLTRSAQGLLKAIEDENTVLESGKLSNFEHFLQKKLDSLSDFNKHQEDFSLFECDLKAEKENPDFVSLLEIAKKIESATRRNGFLLQVNMEISEIIVSNYKEGQAREALSKSWYNKQGKFIGDKDTEKSVPSISLNDKV